MPASRRGSQNPTTSRTTLPPSIGSGLRNSRSVISVDPHCKQRGGDRRCSRHSRRRRFLLVSIARSIHGRQWWQRHLTSNFCSQTFQSRDFRVDLLNRLDLLPVRDCAALSAPDRIGMKAYRATVAESVRRPSQPGELPRSALGIECEAVEDWHARAPVTSGPLDLRDFSVRIHRLAT